MTTPKRQHWVPRFYLKHFTVDSNNSKQEQVWILNRRSGDPRLTSIKNIAVEKHLYTPKRPDGSRDPYLEKKLAGLEGTLAKFWPQLANGFMDLSNPSFRRIVSLFLSVQFLRHPDRRKETISFRRRLIEFIEGQPLGPDGLPNIDGFQIGDKAFSLDKTSWPNYKNADTEEDLAVWRRAIEADAVKHAEMLMKKRWSIVFIDEPLFVTSDYPIFVPEPELERYQIAAKRAVILFPLSPTRVLSFDDMDEPANQYYPIDKSNADIYNLMTWVNTESFLISPRHPHDVLAGIGRVKREKLSLIWKTKLRRDRNGTSDGNLQPLAISLRACCNLGSVF
jgi:hypothetical protein